MLKEFIEHIQSTTKPQIFEKDGATFVVYAEEAPHQLDRKSTRLNSSH